MRSGFAWKFKVPTILPLILIDASGVLISIAEYLYTNNHDAVLIDNNEFNINKAKDLVLCSLRQMVYKVRGT